MFGSVEPSSLALLVPALSCLALITSLILFTQGGERIITNQPQSGSGSDRKRSKKQYVTTRPRSNMLETDGHTHMAVMTMKEREFCGMHDSTWCHSVSPVNHRAPHRDGHTGTSTERSNKTIIHND